MCIRDSLRTAGLESSFKDCDSKKSHEILSELKKDISSLPVKEQICLKKEVGIEELELKSKSLNSNKNFDEMVDRLDTISSSLDGLESSYSTNRSLTPSEIKKADKLSGELLMYEGSCGLDKGISKRSKRLAARLQRLVY